MALDEPTAPKTKESGGAKLAGLIQMMKRDRAERHFQAGLTSANRKEWEEAVEELVRAIELFQELEDANRQASVLSSLSLCHYANGDLDLAQETSERTIELMSSVEDAEGEATAVLGLAHIFLTKGDLEEAKRTFFRAFSMFRVQDNWDGVMRSHLGLERVALEQGSMEEAVKERELAEEARRKLANGF